MLNKYFIWFAWIFVWKQEFDSRACMVISLESLIVCRTLLLKCLKGMLVRIAHALRISYYLCKYVLCKGLKMFLGLKIFTAF